jgi:Helicase associated domain
MVPTHYSSNARLGTWVHHQRRQYREYKRGKPCHITPERIAALDKIGFIWHPRDKSGKSISLSDDSEGDDIHAESDDEGAEFDLRPKKRVRSGDGAGQKIEDSL